MSTRSTLDPLRARLPELMAWDAHRLRRRIDGAHKARDPHAVADKISADIAAAESKVQQRQSAVPRIEYPEQLPVTQRRDALADAIRDHQVVIVAGETGSGKTTQLPKICLELGRGIRGQIGHTQPRRLAARTVADRVTEELATPVGTTVGYKVRFTDQSGDDTLLKLMTDGILLAEIQHDRLLRQYDTIIIDEAHERSLNIDFLLGYLKQVLPRRPDLKVIITSATIEPERFARHFASPAQGVRDPQPAPIVEVSGRTYPVEVRYRPIVDDTDPNVMDKDRDQTQAICDAVDELAREGPGDVLVFLSGEREIRDTADALRRQNRAETEILPLYARLSAADQHRAFQRHSGRRIVLATNVAETSLTVPGIKYVVDPGTARISRYSHRTKVQRLPIEAISQASADQRKGRCGRTSNGICIRLYSPADFEARQEFTDPEIVRTNLASVILQMISLGLGDVAAFPFVDPPDRRQVADGRALLAELGALETTETEGRTRLTTVGRQLAQLPVDPRMGRMIVESAHNGCVREVMVIAAALSIQDPRERPAEKPEAARQQHAHFDDKNSDFQAYVHLWEYLADQQKALSTNQFRKRCKAEYLNYLRVREWQDVYSQLRALAKPLGINITSTPSDSQRVHTSVAAGLLSHIGLKDSVKGDYLGARGTRFAIFPGSSLVKQQPQFVMAAELVETSRLWGRTVARIEPEWVEPLAAHVVKCNYSEPHWERKQGAVMAYEKVTLYGVPLVADRKVHYGRIDPELCRELFIRHALVEGDWHTNHRFFHHNQRMLDEVAELEHRARRHDILVDDETMFDFYDRRVGADVVSARHFDSWWKKARRDRSDLLDFDKSLLVNTSAETVSGLQYPETWSQGELSLPLSYQFGPGADADGITVHIPLQVLNQVTSAGFDWAVPGSREELVTALIKSLPKQLRRNFVPAPDTAKAVLARVGPSDGPLLDVLARELERLHGVAVPMDAWHPEAIPAHLRITFRVVDERNRVLGESKDLDALKRHLGGSLRSTISAAAESVERSGLRAPSFGTLPPVFETSHNGHPVQAYPALVDEHDSVAVRALDTTEQQQRAMWAGTRRLLRLNLPSPMKFIDRDLPNESKLMLRRNPHGSIAALAEDCLNCAIDKLIADNGGPAWQDDAFHTLLDRVRAGLAGAMLAVLGEVERILRAAHEVRTRLDSAAGPAQARADMRDQLDSLAHAGFVTRTGYARLGHLVRYLRGIEQRLTKLPTHPERDSERMRDVHRLCDEYRSLVESLPPGTPPSSELTNIGWMLEELRVSYFAQELGTAHPISAKRILHAVDTVAG